MTPYPGILCYCVSRSQHTVLLCVTHLILFIILNGNYHQKVIEFPGRHTQFMIGFSDWQVLSPITSNDVFQRFRPPATSDWLNLFPFDSVNHVLYVRPQQPNLVPFFLANTANQKYRSTYISDGQMFQRSYLKCSQKPQQNSKSSFLQQSKDDDHSSCPYRGAWRLTHSNKL